MKANFDQIDLQVVFVMNLLLNAEQSCARLSAGLEGPRRGRMAVVASKWTKAPQKAGARGPGGIRALSSSGQETSRARANKTNANTNYVVRRIKGVPVRVREEPPPPRGKSENLSEEEAKGKYDEDMDAVDFEDEDDSDMDAESDLDPEAPSPTESEEEEDHVDARNTQGQGVDARNTVDENSVVKEEGEHQQSYVVVTSMKKLNTKGEIIELGESQLISEEDLFIEKIVQNNIKKTDYDNVQWSDIEESDEHKNIISNLNLNGMNTILLYGP